MQATTQTDTSLRTINLKTKYFLNSFAEVVLLNELLTHKIISTEAKEHAIIDVKTSINLVDIYNQLFFALLNMLERKEYLKVSKDRIVLKPKIKNRATRELLEKYNSEKEKSLPYYEEVEAFARPYSDILQKSFESYFDILSGKKHFFDVLFPKGDMRLVANIYKGPFQQYNNELIAKIAKEELQARIGRQQQESSGLQVLEVGAGTGGTTAGLLEEISTLHGAYEYWYTDISAGFARLGSRQFAEQYPFTRFKALDISSDPQSQGFTEGSMDLIICNNVLHATRNMEQTLTHLHTLLKKGGMLVINELTQRLDFITLVFGLMPDWWNFQDEQNRIPHSPLMSPGMWKDKLAEKGFRNISIQGVPGMSADELLQSVIIAEKN